MTTRRVTVKESAEAVADQYRNQPVKLHVTDGLRRAILAAGKKPSSRAK